MFSFVCGLLTCLLLCTATGTDRWKEHLDVFKMSRKYIGLWRACLLVEEGNYAQMPPYYECDKDFLRPHLVEPPGESAINNRARFDEGLTYFVVERVTSYYSYLFI